MPTVADTATPYFNGNSSFLAHPTLVNAFAITHLYIEIRPSSLDGLILFNGQNNGPDFVALLLRGGRVEFHYNLGTGPAVIVSNTILAREEWHTIEARRSGQSGTLIVNRQMPIVGVSPGGYTSLQLNGDLLIGGARDMITLPDELSTDQHFFGCIRELQTQASGGQSVPLVNAALKGADIGDCPACSCINGGLCVEGDTDSYYCDCPLGYTGASCESELCAILNPCQNGGQCYAVAGEAELMCNCTLPFGGDHCNNSMYPLDNDDLFTVFLYSYSLHVGLSFNRIFIASLGYLQYNAGSIPVNILR